MDICEPRSTYSSGRIATIMATPTKLNEPISMNVATVGGFAADRSSCGKNRISATKMTDVWTRP